MKPDRQAKKRADLEMLSTLLSIANQFGPEAKNREALGAEQVMSARLGNRAAMTDLPFRGREAEARIGTVEDQRRYAGETHPLQLKDMRGAITARGLDNDFNRQAMSYRLSQLKSGAALAGTEAQQARDMMPLAIRGATQQLDQRQQMFPWEKRQAEQQFEFGREGLKQRREEFPLTQTATALSNANQLQQLGMVGQFPVDAPGFLRGQGVDLPMGPRSVDPATDDAELFQRLLDRGIPPELIKEILTRR